MRYLQIILILFILQNAKQKANCQDISVSFDLGNTIDSYLLAEEAYNDDDYENANNHFSRVLEEPFLYGNDSIISAIYKKLSFCQYHRDNIDTALIFARKSLYAQRSLDPIKMDLSIYRVLCLYHSNLEQNDLSIMFLHKGLKIANKIQNHKETPKLYSILGSFFDYFSLYDSAIYYYNCSNNMKSCDSSLMITNYSNIARINNIKGDYATALILYDYVINLSNKLYGSKSIQTIGIYNDIGIVYYDMGDYYRSLEYFNKVVSHLDVKKDDPIFSKMIISNLGDIYRKLGRTKEALDSFRKAQRIIENHIGKSSLDYAFILHNIANIYKDQAKYDTAITYYKKSRKIREQKLGSNHYLITQNLLNIALVYYFQDSLEIANIYLDHAINSNLANDTTKIHSNSLDNILLDREMLDVILLKGKVFTRKYEIYKNINDLIIANTYFELSLELSENIFNDYSSVESQIILNKIIDEAYSNLINNYWILLDFTKDKNYKNEIFKIINKSKNTVLYRLLKKYNGFTLNDSLNSSRNSERDLVSKFYLNQLKKIISTQNSDSSGLMNTQQDLFKIISKIDSVNRNQTTETDSYFDKISLDDFQNNLDDSIAILEYYYNDSILFIISISKLKFDIQRLRIKDDLNERIEDYIQSIKFLSLESFNKKSNDLYTLLIKPIIGNILHCKSLMIIPHQNLFLLPFETLISDTENKYRPASYNYLIKDHDITYNYSSSILYNQIISDDPIEYRYSFTGFAPFSNNQSFEKLESLSYSEQEVQEINDLFKNNGNSSSILINSEATENKYKEASLSSKIIHIATHGIYNKENSDLSGILFSEYYSQSNDEDGILYPKEIYSIHTNTDLLVLGACESGLGKIEKGEGMISIVRSLYFSGTKNIILSLYKLPDKQTKELMISFYKSYLKGNNYCHALRDAKLKLIENESTAFPIYWGGLILVGK